MPSDIDTLPDVEYLQNVTYGPSTQEKVEIDTPTLMVPAYHVCYAHAILDYTFLYYWLITELKLKYPEFTKFNILFEKEEVMIDHNVASVVDNVNRRYNIETWNVLVHLLTDSMHFEHLLEKEYKFKHLFFYKKNQIKYQRCPWNSNVNYSFERHILPENVVFTDNFIYKKLNDFRIFIFEKLNLKIPDESVNSLIIIERSTNRRFDSMLFQGIIKEVQIAEGLEFKGTYCLDKMSFKEQVELFSKTKVFIMRHGSSEINLLWVPEGSTVIEIGGGPEGFTQPNMYKRICKLTNTKHIHLDYNTLLNKARAEEPLDFALHF